MKRRVFKKWINRHITPLIKDLPMVNGRGWDIDLGNGLFQRVEGENHSLKNGYDTPEGEVAIHEPDIKKAILRTRDTIQHILSTHKHVKLRLKPEIYNGRLYMRLITEKVN